MALSIYNGIIIGKVSQMGLKDRKYFSVLKAYLLQYF